ncbi:hypothetical protein [Winogradskyella sp.]|uniref:dioxygenase family protein n=1 Tax=Winogradskyella sp. TaxID=1883156 RepID=UPI003BA8E94E
MRYLRLIVLLGICSLYTQCAVDRTINNLTNTEQKTLNEFKQLDSINKLHITEDNEPGEKLVVCVTLVNKANLKVLPNQKVRFYHTSDKGEYDPVDINDESTARLSGEAYTDKKGKIYVETILPGDYGSSEDNRHIHTSVFGAQPEAYDINFNQYTGHMGRNFINGSDQHFLADLKRSNDGTLVCFITIEVKNPRP